MPSRKLCLLAALTCSVMVMAGSASATTALRTDPGGELAQLPIQLDSTTSDPITLSVSGLGTLTCSKANLVFGDFNTNSSATSIAGTLTSLTFTTCTDTIPVINISSCRLSPNSALPSVSILANNDIGGTTTINDMTVRCNIAGSSTNFCYYTAASAAGAGNNAASSLRYSNVVVAGVTGVSSLPLSVCGTAGTLDQTYTHLIDDFDTHTITITTS